MEKKEQYALIFRALADENRIRILELIGREEKNAGELLEQLEVVQSTLSHHMKVLTESGLVSARKSGKWTYYAICGEVLEEAGQYLFHMKGAAGDTALRPAEGTEKTSEKPARKPAGVRKETPARPAPAVPNGKPAPASTAGKSEPETADTSADDLNLAQEILYTTQNEPAGRTKQPDEKKAGAGPAVTAAEEDGKREKKKDRAKDVKKNKKDKKNKKEKKEKKAKKDKK